MHSMPKSVLSVGQQAFGTMLHILPRFMEALLILSAFLGASVACRPIGPDFAKVHFSEGFVIFEDLSLTMH